MKVGVYLSIQYIAIGLLQKQQHALAQRNTFLFVLLSDIIPQPYHFTFSPYWTRNPTHIWHINLNQAWIGHRKYQEISWWAGLFVWAEWDAQLLFFWSDHREKRDHMIGPLVCLSCEHWPFTSLVFHWPAHREEINHIIGPLVCLSSEHWPITSYYGPLPSNHRESAFRSRPHRRRK